jgi:predicted TIM-barrel fold metal-dependent hydrolase
LLTPRILDGELRRACAGVFNDYLIDYAAHDHKRLVGVALLPIDDVPWALEELERIAARRVRGVMVPVNPSDDAKPYRDPYYDPVWASVVEKALPVTLHSGTGKVPDPSTCFASDVQNVPGTFIEYFAEAAPALTNEFIFGGVFDRFPQLQLYLSEFDASWLPILRYRLERIEKYPGLQPLKKPANQYLDDNVYVGFINDPLAAKLRSEIGVDRMLWGSDFPHPPCPFPNIRERLDSEILVDVPDDERRKLVADNVAKLYGIEP